MDPEKLAKSCTTDGQPPRPGFEARGAPAPIDPRTGMYEAYWVLCEEEREKGFVRPVRRSYIHEGIRPKYPLRDLTPEEQQEYKAEKYIAFEVYPPELLPLTGRYWSERMLKSGCGGITTMGTALAETYARDPEYYGATFCANCGEHFPVGEKGEFRWIEVNGQAGSKVGT